MDREPGFSGVLAPAPVASARMVNARTFSTRLAQIWGARRVWMSVLAVGLALYGQKLLIDYRQMRQTAVAPAVTWYAAGIVLMIVAWWGTYKNKTCLLEQSKVQSPKSKVGLRNFGLWTLDFGLLRYALVPVAVGLNVFSAGLLRADYYSVPGSFGWLASLLLLLAPFLGRRAGAGAGTDVDAEARDVEDRTDPRIPRKVEVALFLGIFALALGLRLYRVGDLTAGMNVDEGGFGVYALRILGGETVSPFATWWMTQENFSWWAIALAMKVFGTDLFGLRMFPVIAGTLMIIPFYGLVRMWFGVRTALIAAFLLAVMEISVHNSRLAGNNIMTPFCLVTGFYFLFRGLRSGRTLDFVLAGYAHMLSLYFYYAGRLTPILLVAVLGYLFVLMPLVGIPGAYRDLGKSGAVTVGGFGRLKLLGQAMLVQAHGAVYYWRQILVFALACFCFASPYLVYFLDHQGLMGGHMGEKLIFTYPDGLAAQYHVGHDPLYVGLRIPGAQAASGDANSFLPVTFEQTPASVKLSDDGFWARVLWKQTATVLGMFAFRGDMSGFYPFNGAPIVQPFEAVLLFLGLAWALWRWRDTRMAVLSMWFWSAVIAGGVLTVDTPYFARMSGIIPTLAVFAAIPLNKLAAEFANLASGLDGARGLASVARRAVRVGISAGLLSLLVFLGVRNSQDYVIGYMGDMGGGQNAPFDGGAYLVREINRQVTGEGRPTPVYYDFGAFGVGWTHNANRFINYGTYGVDVRNPANVLPVMDGSGRDVVFIFEDVNQQYLDLVKSYYPGGTEARFQYGPYSGRTFYAATYYRVKGEQIAAMQTSRATYTLESGDEIIRDETGLGTTRVPPNPLIYPAQVTWRTGLVAPAYARYSFQLAGAGEGSLVIDGLVVISSKDGSVKNAGEVILARGPHEVALTGTLKGREDRVRLRWSAGGSQPVDIARKYLWSGPGGGLVGEVRPQDGNGTTGGAVQQRRVDGFLGFRHATEALADGKPLAASWSGTLAITEPGDYGFDIFSNGPCQLMIDDQPVANNPQAAGEGATASGAALLTAGEHRIKVLYQWTGGTGYLELYWKTPGGASTLMGPRAFGNVPDPPAYHLPPTDDARPLGSGDE